MIIWDDGGDLRLLEHELGNEDRVRIAGPAPGEIAPMPTIPTQQATTKFGRLKSHSCTQINTDSGSKSEARFMRGSDRFARRPMASVVMPRIEEGPEQEQEQEDDEKKNEYARINKKF